MAASVAIMIIIITTTTAIIIDALSSAANFSLKTLIRSTYVTWITCLVMTSEGLPYFDVSLVNVTVVQGQDVLLQCSIDHLGFNMVAWLNPNSMALTLGEERVIDDARFSLVRTGSRQGTEEWNLHIDEVRLSDAGQYRCSVNTDPVKFKVVVLHVKVPPRITLVEDSDVIVMEFDTLTISCNGTGIPTPEVTWKKIDDDVSSEILQQMRKGSSQMLYLPSIRKEHTGVYKCVADNGVPPVASSYVHIKVQFAPKIILPLKRLGQNMGREVLIDCTVRAYPMGEAYWMDQSKNRVISIPEYFDESDDEVTVRLGITRMRSKDYGIYQCCAKNLVGSDCQELELYEYKGESRTFPSPRLSTTTIEMQHRIRGPDDDIKSDAPERLKSLTFTKTFWNVNKSVLNNAIFLSKYQSCIVFHVSLMFVFMNNNQNR